MVPTWLAHRLIAWPLAQDNLRREVSHDLPGNELCSLPSAPVSVLKKTLLQKSYTAWSPAELQVQELVCSVLGTVLPDTVVLTDIYNSGHWPHSKGSIGACGRGSHVDSTHVGHGHRGRVLFVELFLSF